MSSLLRQVRSTDWLLLLLPGWLFVRILGPERARQRAQAELERGARERYWKAQGR